MSRPSREEKERIRRELRALRRALEPEWVERASAQAQRAVQALDAFRAAGTVCVYLAIRGEVQSRTLIAEALAAGKRLCVPVFSREAGRYELAWLEADTALRQGPYAVPEPVAPEPVSAAEVDIMIVPGVAFSPRGARLGRGGGYYDRLMAGRPCFKAGLAFEFQMRDDIPVEQHDVAVNAVVTEKTTHFAG